MPKRLSAICVLPSLLPRPRRAKFLATACTRVTTLTFDILKANPTMGRAEVLRRAELSYLNDTSDPRDAHPAFWGPFEIVGEGSR